MNVGKRSKMNKVNHRDKVRENSLIIYGHQLCINKTDYTYITTLLRHTLPLEWSEWDSQVK